MALLLSDVEESAIRWELRSDAMRQAVGTYKGLLREAIESRGGAVLRESGDGFCAAFPNASEALQAALDVQTELSQRDWSSVDGLMVRMAVHAEREERDDGDRGGAAIACAERLLRAAHGGQIVVSSLAAEHAGVTPATLRDRFPLLREIEPYPTNLPAQASSFVGRKAELRDIAALLLEHRVVTVTGPAGIGKTRMALQVAMGQRELFADGVWAVELEALESAASFSAAIAVVFGIELSGARGTLNERIVLALKNKHALLVLDGCRRAIAEASATIERIVQQCPHVRVLATSREPLGLAGERVFELAPLAEKEGVELFIERARTPSGPLVVSTADRSIVGDIVHRLGGNALAVELAAALVETRSVDLVLQRLPLRPSLHDLIDWSCTMLGPAERELFLRLAVFEGGWTLDAAAWVCAGGDGARWAVAALLESLAEAALVAVERRAGEARFAMVESVRDVALERLEESGLQPALAARHFDYFLSESERAFGRYWRTNLDPWHAALHADLQNYRAAIDWSLNKGRDPVRGALLVANLSEAMLFEIADAIETALQVAALEDGTRARLMIGSLRKRFEEGEVGALVAMASEAAAIFERCGDAVHYVEALVAMGSSLYRMGNTAEAARTGERAIAIARQTGLPRLIASVLTQLGLWVAVGGDFARGRAMYEEAIALLRAQDDYRRMNVPLSNLAELLFADGDVAAALERIYEALALEREIGNEHAMLISHLNIAGYLMALDRTPEAWSNARVALEIGHRLGESLPVAMAVGHLAQIAARAGDAERAARLLGFADAAYRQLGRVREPTEQRGYLETSSILRDAISKPRLDALRAEGAAMSEERAVDQALAVNYLML